MASLNVAVIGATGIVGQQFLVALDRHPWFRVAALAASERSAGRSYRDALLDARTGALRWYCDEPPPEWSLELPVQRVEELDPRAYHVVFTAVESDQAREIEPAIAQTTPVISTASAFRYDEDVPLLVPGVNPDHARLIERQRAGRGWRGFIAPIPNCTTTGLVSTLKPIYDRFGIRAVLMTSLQALSGAGRSPGVIGLDILDNVIPYIVGEEEKVQRETQKILGALVDGAVRPAEFPVSCTCTRVNVLEGHTESVFVGARRPCTVEDVRRAMREHATVLAKSNLPSAPPELIVVHDDPFRPQPRRDRDTYGGMATVVGRLREDPVLEHGVKYVLVSHNTKMGAAKGAVLVAEQLVQDGYIVG
ncbi:MAG TPA: aspartate-semialdehyde dehydrogenase [Chloroflexota bacterium]